MIIGIESTAHTFSVGIVNKGKILANIRDMYRPLKGGIIPHEAAKHHEKVAPLVWKAALEKAGILEKNIKAIALSNAPGLAPCLVAGLRFSQQKAKELGVRLVPVNHCIAHLEIGQSVGARDPILLYASGANTQIIGYSASRYRVFGETLDMGIGNFLDSFARELGIPFPGGPEIEKRALKGAYLELPYTLKGMDVSFSGLYTQALQLFQKGAKQEDVCYSLQETAFAMLVEASERAMAHTEKKELVLGGGVACNARLQEMCAIMCKERGARCFCPAREFLVDNGAMIAYTGEIMYKKGLFYSPNKVDIKPRERTDDIKVTWK